MSRVPSRESVRVTGRSGRDVGDLDLGVLLAVTLALLVAGLVLVLLDHDLRTLGGAEHLDGHDGLVEPGGGHRVAVDGHHDGQGERLADGHVGLVDLDDVAHGNLLLLAASAHDRVHRGLLRRSRKLLVRRPESVAPEGGAGAGPDRGHVACEDERAPRIHGTAWATRAAKRDRELEPREARAEIEKNDVTPA